MTNRLYAFAAPLIFSSVLCNPTLSAQCGFPCVGTPGGTMVPGGPHINQTWCLQNSPYIVMGNISVGGLCIEPGVEVLVDPGFEIDVSLTIIASGTTSLPITFDCSTPGMSWAGFKFQNTPSGSVLRNCIIRHSSSSAVKINAQLTGYPPILEECLIEENTNFGGSLRGGGVDASFDAANPANLVLKNCQFIRNTSRDHGGGIKATMGTGTLDLKNCTFEENHANPTSIADNSVVGGAVYLVGTGDFKNCTFRGNSARACNTSTGTAQGGAIYASGDLSVANCTIRNNTASTGDCNGGFGARYAYGGGISMGGTGNLTIRNCVIACNTTSAAHRSWGAIYINTAGTTALIENSTMAHNNREAVWAQAGTVTVTNSILYYNNLVSSGVYGLQIGGPVVVGQCYNDIQNGTMTLICGNIDVSPFFVSGSFQACTACDLKINFGSFCMDAGDPNGLLNDASHPPAPGSAPANSRNDMGAHGGPGNDQWGVGAIPYNFCETAPNSVDPVGAVISFTGSTSHAANNFGLVIGPVPNQPGIFFYGPETMAPMPFGDGFLCVDGGFIRLPVVFATNNQLAFTVDNSTLLLGEQFEPGCTWKFQGWYRDPTGPGGNFFNLSDGLCVTFRP